MFNLYLNTKRFANCIGFCIHIWYKFLPLICTILSVEFVPILCVRKRLCCPWNGKQQADNLCLSAAVRSPHSPMRTQSVQRGFSSQLPVSARWTVELSALLCGCADRLCAADKFCPLGTDAGPPGGHNLHSFGLQL